MRYPLILFLDKSSFSSERTLSDWEKSVGEVSLRQARQDGFGCRSISILSFAVTFDLKSLSSLMTFQGGPKKFIRNIKRMIDYPAIIGALRSTTSRVLESRRGKLSYMHCICGLTHR